MSRADVDRIDEERVRKVAADNPDLLHTRLAQRFGISLMRLRKILGVTGCGGELVGRQEIPHYTPNPRAGYVERHAWMRRQSKTDELRKKLRAREDEKRTSWVPNFAPMRPPNGRGGP